MLCSIVQSNDDVERGRRQVNKWRKPFECYWNYIDCMPRWIQGGTKKIVLVNQIPIEKTYTTWWPKVFQSKISQFTLKKKVFMFEKSHLSRYGSIYGIAFVDGEVTACWRRALMNNAWWVSWLKLSRFFVMTFRKSFARGWRFQDAFEMTRIGEEREVYLRCELQRVG